MFTIEIYKADGSIFVQYQRTTRMAAVAERNRWQRLGFKAAVL